MLLSRKSNSKSKTMMKKLIVFFVAFATIVSCTRHPEGRCVINGTIDDPDNRDGEWIFIVPQGPHEPSEVDSVLIDNGRFTFVTDQEKMGIIRVTMYRRLGLQDLLVVTEPGEVKVTISASSSCGGTPQNDSLQVWKELTETATMQRSSCRDKAVRDSIHNAYKQRSRQIAHNCGDESTLGKFLLSLYPEKPNK